ncbi:MULTISPECIES: VOC family protein [Sporosarcina]|uniref:VOC family protein n=1 Tax=Sporosarcina contaminans TaxID=633403 RepID=A0ABW3TXJ7_9BACL
MGALIQRVGTNYIPVEDPQKSSRWYQEIIGAVEKYSDHEKAIIDLANQSFFLVKAQSGERANFFNHRGFEHFCMTFEVDGIEKLRELHAYLQEKEVMVGNIEDRGHQGNNFIFIDVDGNKFDVWSELSPDFKERYGIN